MSRERCVRGVKEGCERGVRRVKEGRERRVWDG